MNLRVYPLAAAVAAGLLLSLAAAPARAQDLDKRLKDAEAKRAAVVEKIKPTVVAVFAPGGNNGGSGVLIDEEGYALTNFHVTQAAGNVFKCGLADGVLYDAVLVGLDKVGDVALIKLLPKKEGDKFPFAKMGDSDKVRAGDWSIAAGNPFLLATDFTPTVTYGLISGVHRYQYPAGTLLEYTDCIQIDTSINPGNSGGPLYNVDGEIIGINGRGSFEKRGRVNSGVGYAISINQIKNFLGHLRAGIDTDHASLGAIIESESEDGIIAKMVVRNILERSDAARRGVEPGDQLVMFSGRGMSSVNQYKNVMGIYPKGWRVPIVFRHENEKKEVLVRLMGTLRQEIPSEPKPGDPKPDGPKPPAPPRPAADSPAAKLFDGSKAGYANYYFNKLERDKLLAAVKKQGDFSSLTGEWDIKATGAIKGARKADARFTIKTKDKHDVIDADLDGLQYSLEPVAVNQPEGALVSPPGSGGLLMALYMYRQLLVYGPDPKSGFTDFSHGGSEPYYLPAPEGARPDWAKLRVDCNVIRVKLGTATGKFYFTQKDNSLIGYEVETDKMKDPCEVYLSEYQKVGDQMLPGKMQVRQGDKVFADLTIAAAGYKLSK